MLFIYIIRSGRGGGAIIEIIVGTLLVLLDLEMAFFFWLTVINEIVSDIGCFLSRIFTVPYFKLTVTYVQYNGKP